MDLRVLCEESAQKAWVLNKKQEKEKRRKEEKEGKKEKKTLFSAEYADSSGGKSDGGGGDINSSNYCVQRKKRKLYTWNEIFEAATEVEATENALQSENMKIITLALATNRDITEVREVVCEKKTDPYLPLKDDTVLSAPTVWLYVEGRKRAKAYIDEKIAAWEREQKNKRINKNASAAGGPASALADEGIQFLVRVNPWLEDMLTAYDPLLMKIKKGPPVVLLNNFLFVTHPHLHTTSATWSDLKSFPLDLPYVFAKFGGMLASLVFMVDQKNPILNKLSYVMTDTLISDTQFFYHFAAYYASTHSRPTIDYQDFMENELEYFPLRDEPSQAVVAARNLIYKVLTPKAFFPVKNTMDKNCWHAVPDEIVELLAPFLINNVADEITRTKFLPADEKLAHRHQKSMTRDSPFGRYLNFSIAAAISIKDFVNTQSRRSRITVDQVHLRTNRGELSSLECFRDLFMMISMAAVTEKSLDLPYLFMKKTVLPVAGHRKPIYIASLEAFPGMMPWAFFGGMSSGSSGVENKMDAKCFQEESFYNPQGNATTQKDCFSARLNFMRAFSTYAQNLPKMTRRENYKFMPGMIRSKPYNRDPASASSSSSSSSLHMTAQEAFSPISLQTIDEKEAVRGLRFLNVKTLRNIRSSIREMATRSVAGIISVFRDKAAFFLDLTNTNNHGYKYLASYFADNSEIMPLLKVELFEHLQKAYAKDRRFFLMYPVIPFITHKIVCGRKQGEEEEKTFIQQGNITANMGREGNRRLEDDVDNYPHTSFMRNLKFFLTAKEEAQTSPEQDL
ncbi:hypothetical protein CAPTEDRAFT_187484 [Capitella teleta]|uniref:Uncharacterized protein n=1 Tax=Capitella teleta TaxID=283909 RepID=R7TVX5_CAPTE|nr:hypothetical protein CAPTEDRAFT_187484 [Capitella teleta]|eukprot:ELT95155.1 hypothetical protein CAPTEDRAFT_187484 [Capitella teleta]